MNEGIEGEVELDDEFPKVKFVGAIIGSNVAETTSAHDASEVGRQLTCTHATETGKRWEVGVGHIGGCQGLPSTGAFAQHSREPATGRG